MKEWIDKLNLLEFIRLLFERFSLISQLKSNMKKKLPNLSKVHLTFVKRMN